MSGREWRVRWQREGGRLKVRRYVRRGSALRHLTFLMSDPHGRCNHDGPGGDDPPFCVWADRDGYPTTNHETWRAHQGTEPPPWVVEPVMESRPVGAWEEDR